MGFRAKSLRFMVKGYGLRGARLGALLRACPFSESRLVSAYRGTSLIRKSPPP